MRYDIIKPGKKKNITAIILIMLVLVMSFPQTVHGASGKVFSCVIHPCYKHPVTGVIEDSGGESAYATGQGMVEGCIGSTGIVEKTDGGQCYLTFRMSLIDYTSQYSFWVQSKGDKDWKSPASGVTGQGKDENGTTNDITLEVPSENCVVRGQMYVEPMGRSVVFYLYPSNLKEGNSTGMKAAMVDSESTGGLEAQDGQTAEQPDSQTEEAGQQPVNTDSQTAAGDSQSAEKAEGLSLSTAQGQEDEELLSGSSVAMKRFINVISLVIAGVILIAIAAGFVYYFASNWHRLVGNHEDDEYTYDEDDRD